MKNMLHNQRVKARWDKGVKRKDDRLKKVVKDEEPLLSDLLFFSVFSQKEHVLITPLLGMKSSGKHYW